jgi:hypothetical protein
MTSDDDITICNYAFTLESPEEIVKAATPFLISMGADIDALNEGELPSIIVITLHDAGVPLAEVKFIPGEPNDNGSSSGAIM